jgi:hypothetical protein
VGVRGEMRRQRAFSRSTLARSEHHHVHADLLKLAEARR